MFAQNQLYIHTQKLNKNINQAATGKRINSASDDAAGVSVSDGIMTEIRGNKRAVQAIEDGINILKIAEGGLVGINDQIQRIRELTVQAANGINTSTERRGLIREVSQRLQEINRLADATKFNQISLLDGSASNLRLQTGSNSDESINTINIGDVLIDATSTAIGFNGLNITAAAGGVFENGTSARSFLNNIDTALNNLNDRRAQIAAYHNRLDTSAQASTRAMEGYTRSYSSIIDANIASVNTNIVKQNILRESTLNIMMQTNIKSEIALQLLAA